MLNDEWLADIREHSTTSATDALLAEVDHLRARVVVLDCIAHETGMLLEALRPVQGLVSLRMADVKSLLNRLEEIDYGANM